MVNIKVNIKVNVIVNINVNFMDNFIKTMQLFSSIINSYPKLNWIQLNQTLA